MNALEAVKLALALLKGVAEVTPTQLDDIAVGLISGAITNLEGVMGQPVTREQLESLRTKPLW